MTTGNDSNDDHSRYGGGYDSDDERPDTQAVAA